MSRKEPVKLKPKKLTRTRKPEGMSLEEWQIALRREFGRAQNFRLKNLGQDPVFSEFQVTNPETGGAYRVSIRGCHPGDNYCTCPDFAVNTLGTCKHIEFALAKLERKSGGKKALRQGFHPPYSEIYLRYGAQREVCFRPGAGCPARLAAYARGFFSVDGRLKPEAQDQFHTFLKDAPVNGHELRCYEDAVQFVAQLRDDAQRRRAIDQRFSRGATSSAFQGLVQADLYPYQRTGALFAARAGRCLLADDMGLGKTVQAIAAVEILTQAAGIERVLIISPTSLKHQWKREIGRFAADRTVEVVEGLLAKRTAAYQTESFYKITNYDVIHHDVRAITEWKPDVIILDEAQRIKNWQTRRAKCVKRLPSNYAIVLTGTPLENRLEELHSIVEFVDRFHLGPLFRFLDHHQQTDENGRVVGYRDLSQIAKTLEPVLLRRTKGEVLKELPERVDKHFFVPMTDQQWEHHEENKRTVGEVVAKWKRLGFLSEKDQRFLMIALQNMRMSCNSTYLLDKTTDYGVKADETATLLAEILEEPDTKVVIFSQWVRTHEVIIDRLEPRNWAHAFYHGSLRGNEREKCIEQFREDPACRIFLSTDSGGVGLNLQHASVVINMDQPWNPAVLEQRVGRVHRLGQKRNVRVVHFIAQGTIEHGMLDVLAFKKSVFAGVLDGGENEVFLGGSKLKRFMETVDKVTGNIPEAMPSEAPAAPDAEPEPAAVHEEPIAVTEEETPAPVAVSPARQPWEELVAVGMTLFERLTQAVQAPAADTKAAASRGPASKPLTDLVAKDPQTGESYVRLPVPGPDTLRVIAQALASVADLLQRPQAGAKHPQG